MYTNSGRRLSLLKNELDKYTGWWNTVEAADLDNDGDMDLVLGNKGSNLAYETSFENPMKMWVNDYDDNGTIEQLVTLSRDGKDYPLHMKKEMISQLVFLKKENIKASEYARKTIQELLPDQKIQNAIVKDAKISETVIAINDGKGQFTITIGVEESCRGILKHHICLQCWLFHFLKISIAPVQIDNARQLSSTPINTSSFPSLLTSPIAIAGPS